MVCGAIGLAHRVPAADRAGRAGRARRPGRGDGRPDGVGDPAVAFAGYALGGVGHGVKNVLLRALLTARVPEAVHGRAFAAYNAARNTAELGAVGLGGVAVTALGPRAALLLAGLGPVVAALVGLSALRAKSEGRVPIVHAGGLLERREMLLGLALSLVVVAGAPPGPTLAVQDTRDGKLDLMALTLTAPGLDAVTDDRASRPVWPDEASLLAVAAGDQVFFGGVVDASAASVEIEFEGSAAVRVPTVAGEAYKGRDAGHVRFFAGQITGQGAERRSAVDPHVRCRRRGGRRRQERGHRAPRRDRPASLVAVRRRRDITAGRARARARAPLEELCLFVRGRRTDGEPLACRDERAADDARRLRRLPAPPTTLTGFVPDATRRLDLRLGSGRTMRLTPRAAPLDQRRADRRRRAPVRRGDPRRDGPRRRRARARRAAVRVAPPFRRCGEELSRWRTRATRRRRGSAGRRAPSSPPRSRANGGPQLLARDAGDRLCVGLDRLDLGGSDCEAPPLSAFSDGGLHHRSRPGRRVRRLPGARGRDRGALQRRAAHPRARARRARIHRPLPRRRPLRADPAARSARPRRSRPCSTPRGATSATRPRTSRRSVARRTAPDGAAGRAGPALRTRQGPVHRPRRPPLRRVPRPARARPARGSSRPAAAGARSSSASRRATTSASTSR